MNQYTVGQTLYKATLGPRGEVLIARATVKSVTDLLVALAFDPYDAHGYYKIDAETGLIAPCNHYPPAYPTPAAALRALLDDLQAKEASLQESLRTTQLHIELVTE